MTVIQVGRSEDVAIIRVANPPVNALSVGGGVIAALTEAISAAISDPTIRGVVLAGDGRFFSAGADIRDFESNASRPDAVRRLFRRVESSPKPIVAAIHGLALGGGLELALAAHYRIAQTGTQLGLPEVTLGILPGAGGTQRLPRLIGAAAALDMMTGGKPITAAEAKSLGLVDDLVEEDSVAAAVALIAAGVVPRPTGALPVPSDIADAVAAASGQIKPKALSQAEARIIDCVAAIGNGDFDAGLQTEADLFAELMESEFSRGLRHAFFGQRQVARVPGLPTGISPAPIGNVTVVGGGLMGTGIAIALLNAGLTVVLIEPRADGRANAANSIRKTIARDAEKGRISVGEAGTRLARLSTSDSLEAAADADLVIEAVFEDMAVKAEVFGALDRITRPDAILASNTSTLDLDAIAALTTRPERVVGLHFFSPANVMKLLEVVRGAKTAPSVLVTALAFAQKIGKVGVVAGVCDGFIGNRIFEEYLRQAYFLAEEGALPQQIDAAMEAWGMAMGPFRTMDLAGQDIGWSIRKRRGIVHPDRPYSGFPDRVCELGRFGQKTGRGIYLYPDGRTARVDPEIDALLIAYSVENGIVRRTIPDEEIVSRCLLAMVNEGARIIDEGIAYRPIDVDIIYLNGYGMPAERGGPMFQADWIGLPTVLDRIAGFAAGANGWAWTPAPLLVELAGKNAGFGSLNT